MIAIRKPWQQEIMTTLITQGGGKDWFLLRLVNMATISTRGILIAGLYRGTVLSKFFSHISFKHPNNP